VRTCRLSLLLGALAFASAARGGEAPGPKEIAHAYGVEGFAQINSLHFAFNVERDGKLLVSRAWTWEPKDDRVTYKGPGPGGNMVTVSYDRRTQAAANQEIEQGFINDSYWLLFPMHLVWDTGMTVTKDGEQPLPIPPGKAQRLTVRYAKDVGFTPGDVYQLFVGPDQRIVQWVFLHGGSGEARPVTWTDNQRLGPIVVALDHRGPGGSFHLWFSDVSALVGSREVVPQPLR
jgi:hypothetical protein